MPPDNFLGVFGHVNIDYIMPVGALPEPNTSIQVEGCRSVFGGTGANVSLMAASMGVRSALASFVGPDLPDSFRGLFLDAGVDITDLVVVEGYNTPTCRILTDPQGNQIGIMDQGPMGRMEEFSVAEHTVRSSRIIHIGTGRPAHYQRVMALARELGRPIYFDPAQELHYLYTPELFREMLDASHALFANRSEADTAMRYLGIGSEEDLLDHVDMAVITLGKLGSRILVPGETVEIPAIVPERLADPTGAGDAYRAGFYAGLARGRDTADCGRLGAAAASLVLEVEGPLGRLPDWEAVRDRAGL